MLRVISWNISCMGGDPVRKIELLSNLINEHGETMPSVIALQEVTEKTYKTLTQHDILPTTPIPSSTGLLVFWKAETGDLAA